MNGTEVINIETTDCSPFNLKPGQELVLQYFVQSFAKTNVFLFSLTNYDEDASPVAEFNYSTGQWWAGRFVGESTFTFQGRQYKISIKPRFGELFLFRMLEEIFNVKLTETNSSIKRRNDFQFLIKKLISFLWLNMLSKANKHGLPRNLKTKEHKGQMIRGRINVPKTVKSYYTTSQIVSNYREKESDEIISTILLQAYKILIRNYSLGTFNFPSNAQEAINQLEDGSYNVSQHDYLSIKYKDIYQAYKPLVDFSWDIIQRKSAGNNFQSDDSKQGYSFFIDIAEIWELYLKSLLKRALRLEGWNIRDDKYLAYPGKYFQRQLIPDIVLQKGNQVIVFDAKYKRNYFERFDIDRTDFFQIHTYINYFQQYKNVILGGLLYPLALQDSQDRHGETFSPLYGSDASSTKFITDGIDISFLNNALEEASAIQEQFKKREKLFIARIYSQLGINVQ